MAARPGCFITTWRRNIENEHPSDPEQYPWRALALGLDHSDFMAAMAPKPIILLGQEKDYFDARGFEEAADRLRNLYRLLGAEQNFAVLLGNDYHGYSQQLREAMYGWFNQQTGVSTEKREPELIHEFTRVLQCTQHGQVGESEPSTIFSLVQRTSQRLRDSRPPRAGDDLKSAIISALKIPPCEGVADYRKLEPINGYRALNRSITTYAVETEEGIIAVMYRLSKARILSRIPQENSRAILYIAHASAGEEITSDPWLRDIVATEPNATIFACDVRGVGESHPAISTIESQSKGGSDYFHAGLGLMFDFPTPGQRTFDVLRVLDLIAERGHPQIHLAARGLATIPSTFAAVLHDRVDRVSLKHPLTSYADVAESDAFDWPLSALVPAILQSFDLPDCYRELEAKQLNLTEPIGAAGLARVAGQG